LEFNKAVRGEKLSLEDFVKISNILVETLDWFIKFFLI
jgi:hypothetical protein